MIAPCSVLVDIRFFGSGSVLISSLSCVPNLEQGCFDDSTFVCAEHSCFAKADGGSRLHCYTNSRKEVQRIPRTSTFPASSWRTTGIRRMSIEKAAYQAQGSWLPGIVYRLPSCIRVPPRIGINQISISLSTRSPKNRHWNSPSRQIRSTIFPELAVHVNLNDLDGVMSFVTLTSCNNLMAIPKKYHLTSYTTVPRHNTGLSLFARYDHVVYAPREIDMARLRGHSTRLPSHGPL